MVIKQNVNSQNLSDILCKLIKFERNVTVFVHWLDMINSHGFYARNNVKVVKDDTIRNLFLDTYTI